MIEYVGIPYKVGGRDIGAENAPLDCWGLMVKMYQEIYGISLPHYNDISNEQSNDTLSEFILSTEIHNQFIEVTGIVKQGDLILINIFGSPLHIGMALDNKMMIHAQMNSGSVIESFRSRKWQTRVYKIYRHKTLA